MHHHPLITFTNMAPKTQFTVPLNQAADKVSPFEWGRWATQSSFLQHGKHAPGLGHAWHSTKRLWMITWTIPLWPVSAKVRHMQRQRACSLCEWNGQLSQVVISCRGRKKYPQSYILLCRWVVKLYLSQYSLISSSAVPLCPLWSRASL